MVSVDGQVLSAEELDALYVLAAKLKSFLSLNAVAVRKIVKKYDKQVWPAHYVGLHASHEPHLGREELVL